MDQPRTTTPATPLPRRLAASVLVVLTATSLFLMAVGGFASASVDDSPRIAVDTSSQVLGLPIGTAVWILLGVGGLIVGAVSVRHSRRLDVVAAAESALLVDQVVLAA